MNQYSAKETQKAFKESTFKLDPSQAEGFLLTHDLSAAEKLINIEELVHHIIQYKEESLFRINNSCNGLRKVTQTPLAKMLLLTVANQSIKMISDHFPIHTYNPYIDLFIKTLNTTHLIEKISNYDAFLISDRYDQNVSEYGLYLQMANAVDEFVRIIKCKAQSPWFKILINNAHRSSNKNCKGLMNYIDSLFEHYARLLVMRVDLSYAKGNVIWKDSGRLNKYLEAKHDRERFFNNMTSNKLFEHLVGYVWKLEYGAEKGFHYHLLFFFNGSAVREDETIAMLIGEYWKNNITQGRGLYYNCNGQKIKYRNLGIGMIDHRDTHLREGLNSAARYLIKTDYYARMLVPDKGRTFGRGEILQPKVKKLGRMRRLISMESSAA